MSDISLDYIKNNIKNDELDYIFKINDTFIQSNKIEETIETNSLLHKIYLEITNNKTINLKENIINNNKIVQDIKINHNIQKCDVGDIMSIPEELSKILRDSDLYYKYGVNFKNSYINSILIIFDKSFMSLTHSMQETYVKEFKKILAIDLDEKDYWKKLKFNPRIIKKTDMQRILLEDLDIDDNIEKYIGTYLNINILIFDLVNKKKYFQNDFKKNKLTIILFKINNIYEPLLNENDKNYFTDYNYVEFLYKSFLNSQKDLKIILNIKKNSCENKVKIIKSISNYKLKDLQELCKDSNIDIYAQDGKKSKLKKDLYTELKKSYSEYNNNI